MSDRSGPLGEVWRAIDRVMDPCLAAGGHRVSVVDLGLVTRVEASDHALEVGITFTEVGCPFTHRVIDRIEQEVDGLGRYETVRIVPEWKPGWTPERMNAKARRALENGQEALRLRLAPSPTP